MSSNDRVLLDKLLTSRRQEIAPDMPEEDFFELFVADHALWDHNLSWEELLVGLVGGGQDGGIDAVYVFCNGILLGSEIERQPRGEVRFEVVIIQAKRSPGFDESPIDRLRTSLSDLLDLGKSISELDQYNEDVRQVFGWFRQTYVALAAQFPSVDVKLYYGSRGIQVAESVRRKAHDLEVLVRGLFSASTCTFSFITPADFISTARKLRPASLDLVAADVITTSERGAVALVALPSYYNFVTADDGTMRSSLFESNVRDYEPRSVVNASIKATLEDGRGDDFWWLNNGVTVVASRAAQYGKRLTLEYPQIVNGLQTTKEIYDYMAKAGSVEQPEERCVLVRVVVPPDDVSRDRIIRATNSQTAIPSVALRATDKIQRDIEQYFLQYGLFYERRRNRYQNERKPLDRIVTIAYLAEAVLAVVQKRPHFGAPRWGGRFLRSDASYRSIFRDTLPLDVYLRSFQLTKKVEMRIRERFYSSGVRLAKRGNDRYILPVATALAAELGVENGVGGIDVDSISADRIDYWTDLAASFYEEEGPRGRRRERVVVDGVLGALTELGLLPHRERPHRSGGTSPEERQARREARRAEREARRQARSPDAPDLETPNFESKASHCD